MARLKPDEIAEIHANYKPIQASYLPNYYVQRGVNPLDTRDLVQRWIDRCSNELDNVRICLNLIECLNDFHQIVLRENERGFADRCSFAAAVPIDAPEIRKFAISMDEVPAQVQENPMDIRINIYPETNRYESIFSGGVDHYRMKCELMLPISCFRIPAILYYQSFESFINDVEKDILKVLPNPTLGTMQYIHYCMDMAVQYSSSTDMDVGFYMEEIPLDADPDSIYHKCRTYRVLGDLAWRGLADPYLAIHEQPNRIIVLVHREYLGLKFDGFTVMIGRLADITRTLRINERRIGLREVIPGYNPTPEQTDE